MKMDKNKKQRDRQRRKLNNAGWKAVPALKANGAFVWRWIFPGRKRAYTRQAALSLVK